MVTSTFVMSRGERFESARRLFFTITICRKNAEQHKTSGSRWDRFSATRLTEVLSKGPAVWLLTPGSRNPQALRALAFRSWIGEGTTPHYK
jgi:hypothetical protein